MTGFAGEIVSRESIQTETSSSDWVVEWVEEDWRSWTLTIFITTRVQEFIIIWNVEKF